MALGSPRPACDTTTMARTRTLDGHHGHGLAHAPSTRTTPQQPPENRNQGQAFWGFPRAQRTQGTRTSRCSHSMAKHAAEHVPAIRRAPALTPRTHGLASPLLWAARGHGHTHERHRSASPAHRPHHTNLGQATPSEHAVARAHHGGGDQPLSLPRPGQAVRTRTDTRRCHFTLATRTLCAHGH
jgi:hypothetical protein